MAKFLAAAKTLVRSEAGASMVEYGLLVALIALVAAAGAKTFGSGLNTLFNNANGSL
jgi:pilus assembly protein Flp/PilA